jgi:hypothetical protein
MRTAVLQDMTSCNLVDSRRLAPMFQVYGSTSLRNAISVVTNLRPSNFRETRIFNTKLMFTNWDFVALSVLRC